ncbi:PREDICTED: selection and upkeep of intraepithelial T-cells protein 8-like [Chrysochloris asiatica]|uniref:Selection and upkeep of intraepithelial T-cells protein 8-like n=1 Tax=Chrysochloris asiatica TaxID=185453 RepID=A0A9B0TDV2_CHRAS|nr:PREDICTED: selection and upkeep of intraepithelial T-cells protein 8-like [Chrysochloris asiatica]
MVGKENQKKMNAEIERMKIKGNFSNDSPAPSPLLNPPGISGSLLSVYCNTVVIIFNMMIPESSACLGYCVMFLLLKALTLTSGKLMVTSLTGQSIATVSGQAELSCQLSPPQSAEHMEVLWFRGDHSKTVHLYRGGYETKEDTSPEYMGRTELLKEAFGEGKVTLRIHNISIYDDGQYQCSFKDSGFYGVANMNLSVIAQGVKTQIQVQNSGIGVVMVVCDSGGWYPKPNVEWRDQKGERIPHSSTSYSQDKAGFFHMTTTLLGNNSLVNLTCYISNPLTGEGRRTNIILEDMKGEGPRSTEKDYALCVRIYTYLPSP